jgi:phosphoglycolate phosphatase-like HAD superfamily hydrolase
MKLFIWDLHGTLEQGNEIAVVELSNKIARDFGYSQQFTMKEGRELYGLRWYEYFEHLLPDESHERHLELQVACFDYSNSKEGAKLISKYIKPSKNAHEILELISSKHKQIVLSNTVPESLPIFLDALDMSKFFDNDSAFAVNQHFKEAKRTKTDVMEEYLVNNTFDELIVIGDSHKDMQLARDIDAKAVLYAHEGVDFRSEEYDIKLNDLIKLTREL